MAVTLSALLVSGCFGQAVESHFSSNAQPEDGVSSGNRPIEAGGNAAEREREATTSPEVLTGAAGSGGEASQISDTPIRCESPETGQELGGQPPEDWWASFAEEQEAAITAPTPGARAPRIAMSIYGVPEDAEPYVAIRSRLGELRLCYEKALAVAPETAGVWVATVEQSIEGGVCSVAARDPDGDEQLPGSCFAEALRDWPLVRATGRFHIAVSFHPR